MRIRDHRASFNLGSFSESVHGERYQWGNVKSVTPDEYDYEMEPGDAAAFNWGGGWRVPSRDEWEDRVKPRQNIVISYQETEPIIQMYVPSGPKIDYLYGRKKVGVKA